MRLLGIADLAARRSSESSTGRRKLVGLARALAGRPSVLLCDEPAAGLDSLESRDLGARLKSIAAEGIGMVLIEYDLALVMDICDRIYVLHDGAVIAAGTPGEIRQNEAVVRAYIRAAPQASEAGG